MNKIKHPREEIKTGFKTINSYNGDYIEVEDTNGKIIKAELTEYEYMFLKNKKEECKVGTRILQFCPSAYSW